MQKRRTVSRTWPDGGIVVNDELTLAVKGMAYGSERNRPGWRLYITRKKQPVLTVLVRMDLANENPMDYFVLPRKLTRHCRKRFGMRNYEQFERYRLTTLADVAQVIAARAVGA